MSTPELDVFEDRFGDSLEFFRSSTDRELLVEDNEVGTLFGIFVDPTWTEVAKLQLVLGSQPRGPNEILVSHAFWSARLGAPQDLADTTLRVQGRTFGVSGVLPPHFRGFFWNPVDLYLPIQAARAIYPPDYFESISRRWLIGIARVPTQELNGFFSLVSDASAELRRLHPATHYDRTARTLPFRELLFGPAAQRTSGALLVGALLTAIACIGNLWGIVDGVVRGISRSLVMRAVLGANAAEIHFRAALPIVAAALLGSAVGMSAGSRLTAWLVAVGDLAPPSTSESFLGGPLSVKLLFLLAGVAGAMTVARVAALRRTPEIQLLSGSKGGEAGPPALGRILHSGVLVTLSAAALMAALLTAQSLRLMATLPIGLSTEERIAVPVQLAADTPSESISSLVESLIASARESGVATSVAFSAPALAPYARTSATLMVLHPDEGVTTVESYRHSISPDAFDLMGIGLLQGRPPRQQEYGTQSGEAVVSSSLAHALWPDESPIGRTFSVTPQLGSARDWIVVGIAVDALHRGPREASPKDLYVPLSVAPEIAGFLVSYSPRGAELDRLREALSATVVGGRVGDPEVLSDRYSSVASEEAFLALTTSLLAAVALMLSSIGTFATVSADNRARTREWVVRRALGLTRKDVFMRIVARAACLSVLAAITGISVVTLFAGSFENLLFGINYLDLPTIVFVVSITGCVGLLAATGPALVASATDVNKALKEE